MWAGERGSGSLASRKRSLGRASSGARRWQSQRASLPSEPASPLARIPSALAVVRGAELAVLASVPARVGGRSRGARRQSGQSHRKRHGRTLKTEGRFVRGVGFQGVQGSREGRAPTARCHRLGSKDRRRTVPARGASLLGPPATGWGGVQRPGRFSVNPGVTRWLGAVVGASPAPPSPHTASGEDRGLMAVRAVGGVAVKRAFPWAGRGLRLVPATSE